MKAFVDWLAGDGQVRPMEIPSAGLVFDGSGSEGRLEFHWERRGGGCTVTAGSEGLQVDSQRIMPGTTRKLEHLEELEWAGRLARFRMEPARPRFKGKEVDDIPLADLPGGSVLVIGRGQQQDQVADTTEWRVDLDPQDSAISRRHVEIRYDSSTRRFAVSDVSSFGAMLNSRAFDTKPLVYGDRIQIRDYYFEFSGNSLRWVDGKVGGSIRARDLEVVVDLKGQKKTILQDVTVAIKSGEFVGILGGSGQGKSTFMNALCGVNPASAGEVEIDGVKLTDRKQVGELSIGFVPQEDLVHRELSVLDAIRFSARLRLP